MTSLAPPQTPPLPRGSVAALNEDFHTLCTVQPKFDPFRDNDLNRQPKSCYTELVCSIKLCTAITSCRQWISEFFSQLSLKSGYFLESHTSKPYIRSPVLSAADLNEMPKSFPEEILQHDLLGLPEAARAGLSIRGNAMNFIKVEKCHRLPQRGPRLAHMQTSLPTLPLTNWNPLQAIRIARGGLRNEGEQHGCFAPFLEAGKSHWLAKLVEGCASVKLL